MASLEGTIKQIEIINEKLERMNTLLSKAREDIDYVQPRAAQLLRAPATQAVELLTEVRDAYTVKGKLPPIELVLHAVNEALKALGSR